MDDAVADVYTASCWPASRAALAECAKAKKELVKYKKSAGYYNSKNNGFITLAQEKEYRVMHNKKDECETEKSICELNGVFSYEK